MLAATAAAMVTFIMYCCSLYRYRPLPDRADIVEIAEVIFACFDGWTGGDLAAHCAANLVQEITFENREKYFGRVGFF
ncbi:hypothetical protein [Mesorhizobium australicum]|uniref:hypothetical protein n=1 Tax=Mesorhizobium australicum TaxID=536018 RepID=UPI0015935967|nr:hypothetical protein [Mesorhizobium australicum]